MSDLVYRLKLKNLEEIDRESVRELTIFVYTISLNRQT